MKAAAPAIRSVKMITLKPLVIPLNRGRTENSPLAAMEMTTRPAINLSFLAGGMMIARNMPYRETLSALTAQAGIILPKRTPRTVPVVQPATEMTVMP